MIADICQHPWNYHIDPFCIAGNLYYVGNKNVSSHLIDTGEGLILLDTAFPQTVYLLLNSIYQLGFHPQDILYIIHSHGHYDHFGGTRALVELIGAKTALGEQDIGVLSARPDMSWAPEYGVEFHEQFDVNLPLRDGDTISLGNTEIRCLHTPGHTDGTMSYIFNVVEGNRQFTAGIHGGPGLNTLSDDYIAKYGRSATARNEYLHSLAKLKQQPVELFIGAHPDQNVTFTKFSRKTPDFNPFINNTDWGDFLARLEQRAKDKFGFI